MCRNICFITGKFFFPRHHVKSRAPVGAQLFLISAQCAHSHGDRSSAGRPGQRLP
jgi:hypothetical protein